jgi:hypothetical protein
VGLFLMISGVSGGVTAVRAVAPFGGAPSLSRGPRSPARRGINLCRIVWTAVRGTGVPPVTGVSTVLQETEGANGVGPVSNRTSSQRQTTIDSP